MIPIEWISRKAPLTPEAVLLPRNEVARQVTALTGRELRGVGFSLGLFVLGTQDELPWLPGASYFARSPVAPDVYVPTALMPRVSELLMARTVRRQAKGENGEQIPGPFAVIPETWHGERSVLLSLRAAARIEIEELTAWLRAS